VELIGDVVTDRLHGRPPEERDVDDYVRIWTDPRVDDDAWPADLRTSDDARAVLTCSIAHWKRWGFGPWTVIQRASNEVIGRVGLAYTRVTGRPEVEVAWFIDPDEWGQGYASEMAGEAIRVAFEVLELDGLIAMTTLPNSASQRVIAKLGFELDGQVEHAGLPHVLFRLARPA
jgi:RimJ/RimL family protein N-acetyltransferase